MAIGGHGISFIKNPPVLQMTPVNTRSPMADLRFKLDPLEMV